MHRAPTSHLFLHNVLSIHQALRNRKWHVNDMLEDLACAMDVTFDKYWEKGKYNMALVIATILDPSKKMDFLDFFYEKMCKQFVDIRSNFDLAKTWFTKYFEEYIKLVQRDDLGLPHVGTRISTLGSPVLGKINLDEEFAQWSQIRGRHFQNLRLMHTEKKSL
jgi:hypothetical protein